MTGRQSDDRGEVVLYRTEDGRTALDVRLAGETVWLTQAQIADLFAVNVPAISKHIKNIYADRELSRKATVSKMETVRTEGQLKINDSALVALALLIAESEPCNKELMIRLVMNLPVEGAA